MAESLRNAVPPSSFKIKEEPVTNAAPSDRSLAAFKAKIDLMVHAQKGKKVVNKAKQKIERVAKQQSWSHSIKRVQCYLGIRQASHDKRAAAPQAGLVNSSLEWGGYEDSGKAAIPRYVYPCRQTSLNPFQQYKLSRRLRRCPRL
jgi:hypothetical protein